MKGIVWGKDIPRAKMQLQRIKDKYLWLGIQPIGEINSIEEQMIRFENGDYWRTLLADGKHHGYKANISYIDELISKENVEQIILPCTVAPPYNAYKYFSI